MDISIVIPLYNESESIIPLGEEIASVCQGNNFKTERAVTDLPLPDSPTIPSASPLSICKEIFFTAADILFSILKETERLFIFNKFFIFNYSKYFFGSNASLTASPTKINKLSITPKVINTVIPNHGAFKFAFP